MAGSPDGEAGYARAGAQTMNSGSRLAGAAAGGYDRAAGTWGGLELGCGRNPIAGFEVLLALDADAGEDLA
jgi:hypothetical protein